MGLFNFWEHDYPNTNFHELNLDWIIKTVKQSEKKIDDFTVFNTLTWAGVWDATKSYVKWSIVQDVSGNGYISIQPVPSNVPLTNVEYWQMIAKYSDLYAAFNTRITTLESTVGDSSSGIVKDINNIKNDISDIENDISDIENDISDIENDISELSSNTNKTCILIGDSYGLSLAESGHWNGWGYEFATAFPDVTCYISAVGGSGFVGDPNVDSFYDQLVAIGNTITDKDAVTDIVVMGGYNDASTSQTEATLITEMKTFADYARSNYKKAKIHVGFIAVDYNSTGMQTTLGRYAKYYETACAKSGCSFITNAQFILLDKSKLFYLSGNPNSYFHPNTSGNQLVAQYLAKYLFSGYFDVIKGETVFGADVYVKNGRVSITNSQNSKVFNWLTGSFTIPFNTWTDLGNLGSQGSNLLWGVHDPNVSGSFCMAAISNSGVSLGWFRFRIIDKSLYMMNDFYTSGTTANGWNFCVNTIDLPFEKAY